MTSTIANVVRFGKSKDACAEAMQWLATQTDPEQAWQTCERHDWMTWYAARRDVDRKVLVWIACDCARTALRFVPEGEDRPRICIETTERWIVGEATIAEVRAAQKDAHAAYAAYAAATADAAYAAAADAAAYAAYADAAAYAADAYAAAATADAAAYAAAAATADAAAYAAAATADAAAYAAYARHQANIQMCDIVRTHVSYQDVAL